MGNKDINAKVQVYHSIAPAAHTTTREGAAVDMAGAESGMALLAVGAVTTLNDTDKVTLTILIGDTTDIAAATVIDADAYTSPRDMSGAEWARILNASFASANTVYQVGFENKTNGQYAFAKLTSAGSPVATMGVSIVKGDLRLSPNAA